jgi:diguanylate cyclase (GGDEF)-like protein
LIWSGLLALALLAVVAAYLAHTQASAADKLRSELGDRAVLAGKLASGALLSSIPDNQAYARKTFGGAGATVQAAVDAEDKISPHERLLVLRADGSPLGVFPHTLRRDASRVIADRAIAEALKGRPAFSDIFATPTGPMFMGAVPFATKLGRRVWVFSAPAQQIETFGKAYLSSALDVDGGRAFFVDGHGAVLASSAGEHLGKPLSERALAGALRRSPTGTEGADHYASAAVPSTTWRVVFAAPTKALLAPIQSTRRAAWQLFGGFALAMVCLLALGASALSRSARLAHERLHDALTGLPNRALFIDHTEQALTSLRNRGGHLAALFIDLDRFKPINDRYGHAIGDALLAAVAARLIESVRGGDTVSRFGGDEFLVLCTDLEDEEQANHVAKRIQEAVSRPFEIDGLELSVGCSIGVALHSVEIDNVDAATLIHNADLAMYRAKQGGRARVESFDPTLTAVSAA